MSRPDGAGLAARPQISSVKEARMVKIKGLHHNAYRCRDSEETRRFYEDFLGLKLANAFEINETKTGRQTKVLHSFYEMGDGSFLAFFDAPDRPFKFKDQHDYDLHIALEVDQKTLHKMFDKGKKAGLETRGISDHGFIDSIYFRDPNGYVVELTAPRQGAKKMLAEAKKTAHDRLKHWSAAKRRQARANAAE
jgi:catechol 2,3-dioxygenase-like lactoylglutathione lyase family enzyme